MLANLLRLVSGMALSRQLAGRAVGICAAAEAATFRTRSPGSRSLAVVPTPSSLLRTSSPPCSSIKAFAIGNPRPVPSCSRVR